MTTALIGAALVLALGALGATTSPNLPAPPTAPSAAGWRLVFSDDFNGQRLNARYWFPGYWYAFGRPPTSSDKIDTVYVPGQVRVAAGLLRLRVAAKRTYDNEQRRTFPYVSGMASTGPARWLRRPVAFSFLYGYAEARMRCAAGPGLLSAFWLTASGRHRTPEVDVAELLGREPTIEYFSFHEWPDNWPRKTRATRRGWTSARASTPTRSTGARAGLTCT